MRPRLYAGLSLFTIGYALIYTNLVGWSMGLMVAGFYLSISALFVYLTTDE